METIELIRKNLIQAKNLLKILKSSRSSLSECIYEHIKDTFYGVL
jgi:hypothetical protein